MINIWEYSVGDRVKITADNGSVFAGKIDSLIDSEECSDLEKQEDNIGIATDDGRYVDIYQSEIKEIVKLSEKVAGTVSRDAKLVSGN